MPRSAYTGSGMYDETNRAAAQIIVAKGITGGLRIWADAVLARLQTKTQQVAQVQGTKERKEEATGRDLFTQGSLFKEGDAA